MNMTKCRGLFQPSTMKITTMKNELLQEPVEKESLLINEFSRI